MALVIKLALFALFAAVLLSSSDAISLRDLMPGVKSERSSGVHSNKDMDNASLGDSEKLDAIIDEEEEKPVKKPTAFQNFISGFGSHNLQKPLQDLHNMLRPKPKPVVTATKTMVIEVTKRVTRHPVCIASHVNKPACLSYKAHDSEPKPYKPLYKDESDFQNEAERDAEEMEIWENDFKNEGLYIEPTAALEMSSEAATAVPELTEADYSQARSARYLEFTKATPAVSEVKAAINEAEVEDSYDGEELRDEEGRRIFRRAQTKVVTKTLWVTRVQKVMDFGVTATLVPHNCVPAETSIPACAVPKPPPALQPGQPGQVGYIKNKDEETKKNSDGGIVEES